jgi:pSer/pThr/pTyr-binding forkhead associated (FHA) protein
MAKLTVQFDDQVLKECAIDLLVTIGRLPDNTVVIENPAVSGHHACIFRDGDAFIIEDLESRNGTFLNDKRVRRQPLRHGDTLRIGKHKLLFDQLETAEPAPSNEGEPALSNLGDTVYLDTHEHRALLAQLGDASDQPVIPAARKGTGPTGPLGILRVLAGRSERAEYDLIGRTSLIGGSESALVRLQGWFTPKVAVAIARNSNGYVATPLGGKPLINSLPLTEKHELKEGDVLRISRLVLEFRLKGRSPQRM